MQTESDRQPALEYVGFWPRLLGTTADIVLVAMIVTPILVTIYGTDYLFDDQLIEGRWHVIIGGILPAVAALWFLIKFQATPGKMIIKSQIVHEHTGDKPHSIQYVIRYLAFSIISILPLGLGCLWILWDKKRQGWHDKLARTVVVKRH